jgi:hypothetical protein
MQCGDAAVYRGQLVTVETVHDDGTIWVVNQNGEGMEVAESDFDHVY